MKIHPNTTYVSLDHAASKFGMPVFVRDGQELSQSEGLGDWMKERELDRSDVARITNRSEATVRGWLYGRSGGGRPMDAAAMNALSQHDHNA